MKVVVAEKPSVARDLARFLGAKNRRDGSYEGDGWVVSWALGHLAELKTPDGYDPSLKRWTLETLPFVPEQFELRPAGDAGAQKQLEIVAGLCRDADELVCATDAGREGELIFRYLLEIAGCPERSFQRLWLSSLTDAAIRTAFDEMKPGSDYEPLHAAARSRSEADWIVGINATRAYTVRFGSGGVLWSVGRVQTPVLTLIAQRDDEIRTFDSETFWELRTQYRNARFRRVGDRFTEKAKAEEELAKVQDVPLVVEKVQKKTERRPPPLLYDLTQLQRDMNLHHGMQAARTLKVAQDLYESKFLTYPRTDCRHLPTDMQGAVPRTLASLRSWNSQAIGHLDLEKLPTPRSVYDDSKVTDHHAIIPTGKIPGNLDQEQQRVFNAVATRLVQAFMTDRVQAVTTVDAKSNDVPFRARGVVVLEPGWSALEPARPKPKTKKGKEADDDHQELPPFEEGESGPHEPELHEGSTKPPRPYTENTLLAAMETAGKLVDDEALRSAMKARGLGTPATRASILETLIGRRYVVRDKKALRVTDLGRYLVAIVSDRLLKSPELTGEWEQKLSEIEGGSRNRSEFMDEIRGYAEELVSSGAGGERSCPACQKPILEGREAFGCEGWRDGCTWRLPKSYRGLELKLADVMELVSRGVLLRPVQIPDEGPRILCLTHQHRLIDLELPSRDSQRSAPRRPQNRGGSKPGPAKKAAPKKAADGPKKPRAKATLPNCPTCDRPLIEGQRGYGCSGWQAGCRFVVWKEIQGKKITVSTVSTLIKKRKTRMLDGFVGPDGNKMKGRLVLNGSEVSVEFEAGA